MKTNNNKRNNSLSEALSSFFNSAAILPVCISVLMAAVNKDLRMLLLFMLCQTGKKLLSASLCILISAAEASLGLSSLI